MAETNETQNILKKINESLLNKELEKEVKEEKREVIYDSFSK